jgi:hypothetical protein
MTTTITFPDVPYVGYIHRSNTIEYFERDGLLLCRMRRGPVLLQQALALLWGSGLTVWLWTAVKNPAGTHLPSWAFGLLGVLALLCWWSALRNLLGTPHLEVSVASGVITLFRRRTLAPSRAIASEQIAKLSIERQFYTYKQRQTENAVLLVMLKDGSRVALCASPDRSLILALAQRMAQLTGCHLDDQPVS